MATDAPSVSRATIEKMPGSRSVGWPVGSVPGTARTAVGESVAETAHAFDGFGTLAATDLIGRGKADRARHVLRPGSAVTLLAAALLLRRGCASRAGRTAAPTPFGPSNLCAAIDRRSTPSASTSRSIHGAACTASTWNRIPRRARTRATSSAIGWMVPTSLFASMNDTRIVRSVMRRLQLPGIDPSIAVDRQLNDLEAELLEVAQGVTDRVMLDSRGHDPVAPRLPGPCRALERKVVRLGAAGREDDLAGLGVQPGRDTVVCVIERGTSRPTERVRRARVAERLGQEREHGIEDLAADRCGRRVIEVDRHRPIVHRSRRRSPRAAGIARPRSTNVRISATCRIRRSSSPCSWASRS